MQKMNNEEFKVFYEKYHKFSAGKILKIVKNRTVAEEICNEAFYRFYNMGEKLELDNERKLKGLLLKICENCALDYFKKSHVIHEQCTIDDEDWKDVADDRETPEARILHMEEATYQKMILTRLRNEQPINYDILMKIKFFGMTPDEVAEEYGITRNNVNNRILRTKHWLQNEFHKVYDN